VTIADVSSVLLSVNCIKLLVVEEKKNDSAAISGKIDEAYKFRIRLREDILSLIFFSHVHCE
jgi:hypothetical protein